MGSKSQSELKQELEAERERLGEAVHTLRGEATVVRRKLPLVAVGAAGAGLAVRIVKSRIARRRAAREETEKPSWLSFLDRG